MPTLKQHVSGRLLKLAGIKRVHIIGCSRSGTSMLQIAMACFDDTLITPDESAPRYPYLVHRLKFLARRVAHGGQRHLITKRNFTWLQDEMVEHLIRQSRIDRIGIVHIVRDPRDVMLSTHLGSDRPGPYVTPEHWYNSILAAERVFDALAGTNPCCTIRYEDIVQKPGEAEAVLSSAFGLRRSDQSFPINRLADNVELKKVDLHYFLRRASGGIRNMDQRSIGKFRDGGEADVRALSDDPNIRRRLEEFCAQHGYR